jgi:signal transduction histidine kinase
MENLLNNAIKFMDKPRGEVRIEYLDEGDRWKFSVADNGPGIAEKTQR